MPDTGCKQFHDVMPGHCRGTADTSLAVETTQDSGLASWLHCQIRQRKYRTTPCCVLAKRETVSVSADSCHSSMRSSLAEAEVAGQWSIQCTLHRRDYSQQVHCADPSKRWQAENSEPSIDPVHLVPVRSVCSQLLQYSCWMERKLHTWTREGCTGKLSPTALQDHLCTTRKTVG